MGAHNHIVVSHEYFLFLFSLHTAYCRHDALLLGQESICFDRLIYWTGMFSLLFLLICGFWYSVSGMRQKALGKSFIVDNRWNVSKRKEECIPTHVKTQSAHDVVSTLKRRNFNVRTFYGCRNNVWKTFGSMCLLYWGSFIFCNVIIISVHPVYVEAIKKMKQKGNNYKA